MTMPIGNPFIALMDRTIVNLDFIGQEATYRHDIRQSTAPELYEVTQAINSFLGVLLMPWERVFNMKELNGYSNKPHALKKLGFDMLKSSRPDEDAPRANLGAMLTSLRHGAAHGGIEILDLHEYRRRVPGDVSFITRSQHIAAVEIESKEDLGKGDRNWGCILNIDELERFLRAAHQLSRNQQFVLQDVWEEHQTALDKIRDLIA